MTSSSSFFLVCVSYFCTSRILCLSPDMLEPNSSDIISPRSGKKAGHNSVSKKRIVVSRADSFKKIGSFKSRSDSLKSSEGEQMESGVRFLLLDPEDPSVKEKRETKEKDKEKPEVEEKEKEGAVNKIVRKYSKPERPLVSLDALKGTHVFLSSLLLLFLLLLLFPSALVNF